MSDALDALGTSHSAAAKELVERLSGLWGQFQDRKRVMTAREQAMTYRLMTDAANQLVRLTLDDSSLVLDSELDTYYLIEFAGQLLLQSQTGVAQARLVLLRGTVDGSVEQRDMAVLQTLNENLNETLIPRLRQSLDTSIREDANFHGKSPTLERNLRPLADDYLKKLTQLSSQLGRFAEMTDVNLRPEQVVESADAAERSGCDPVAERCPGTPAPARKARDRRPSEPRRRALSEPRLGRAGGVGDGRRHPEYHPSSRADRQSDRKYRRGPSPGSPRTAPQRRTEAAAAGSAGGREADGRDVRVDRVRLDHDREPERPAGEGFTGLRPGGGKRRHDRGHGS